MALALAAPGGAQARAHPPVVVLLFDELPVNSLLNRHGHIDRVRFPNFAALARGSTWFPNATTASDATKYSIPAILDGRRPRSRVPPLFRAHRRNLFTLMHRAGYRIYSQEEGTALCPYRACRRRHDTRYYLSHSRQRRFKLWVNGIKASKRPTLYLKHSLLPHLPWVLLPSTQSYQGAVRNAIPGINSPASVFDPELVDQSWQRHLLQTEAVDTLLGRAIARLKRTGIYDRAAVVVMADHGISFHVGEVDRRTLVRANVGSVVPVPFFVKRPRQRRGRVSRAWVHTTDTRATVSRLAHVRVGYRTIGRNVFSRAVRRRHRITVSSRRTAGALTISTRALRSRRQASLRRQIRLFGDGRRSLYARGPNARLLFRPVARLRVRRKGRVRARLVHPERLRHVRLHSSFLPAFVAGRIRGSRRHRRYLAVAVNGRIRGVTRTFRLRHSRQESFTAMVPPSALVQGRNTVDVFQVCRRRGRYVLRTLR
jgi:Sulfatase